MRTFIGWSRGMSPVGDETGVWHAVVSEPLPNSGKEIAFAACGRRTRVSGQVEPLPANVPVCGHAACRAYRPNPKFQFTDRSGDDGFIYQSRKTGATVYNASQQGADPDGGKYVIICVHNRLVNVRSKKDARFIANSPGDLADICPVCTTGDFNERNLTETEDRD